MNRSGTFEFDPQRRALLEALLEEEGLKAPVTSTIPRRKILPSARLSAAQHRLWFLNQLEPENPFYNIFTGIRMVGVLDVEVLKQALEAVVNRHEALRTTFSSVDGVPVQQISMSASLPLPLIDLRQVPLSDRESEAMRLAADEARRPFDLSRGPLARTTVLRLDEKEHLLLWAMHHIVSDGWSMSLIYREIGVFYQALLNNEPSPLPELSIHYPDFTEWQQDQFHGEGLESHLAYWRKELDGAPPLLDLPTDFQRPAVQTFQGASQSILISTHLADRLRELSRQEGGTLFMTLLAAFQICLGRYSGQKDIVVGSPHAGRNSLETEGMVGYFVNMLPLRTSLHGDPSFKELFGLIRETAFGAYAHPDLPFEQLREELRIEGSLKFNPLFQVMFALQNLPLSPIKLPGLTLSPLKLDLGPAKMDLSLWVRERPDGLKAALAHNVDLFTQATSSRIMDCFYNLLQAIAEDPGQPISRLRGISETDRHLVLIKWNNTRSETSETECVQELFEAQVERTPDAVAVLFDGGQLTYRELNSRANRVAHHLRSLGIGAETLVGIALERSPKLIVALLGVLKAGATYVPMDPKYPLGRLAFMIGDAKPKVLLTQASVVKSWAAESKAPWVEATDRQLLPIPLCSESVPPMILCLDSDWDTIGQASEENPRRAVGGLNRAYVIYTSGSTGQPKGVEVVHAGLMNFVSAANCLYGIRSKDRVLQFASISFDAAAEEIFPCLTRGATLVLRTDSMLDSAAVFIEKCHEWKLTILDLPTAYWQTLASEMKTLGLKLPAAVRLVIIGGESATAGSLSDWRECAGPEVQLLNTYGPTEATVVATAHESNKEEQPSARGEIPIGHPILNTQIYLLDSCFQPGPIGAVAQLYIGGAGLARGYLNRPDLTAERFVPNPFGSEPGKCLYKTGDLARYRQDGTLEFMGRCDRQVKLRGFRIELNEIEATLNQHPGVQQAVAMLREESSGGKQLVAYVVAQPGGPPQESELLAFLSSRLPNYMVPSTIVMLEAMPLTPNGKLDRRALPDPVLYSSSRGIGGSSPRSPVEQLLSEIWVQLLGTERVSPHDNFFDLGGHSLLATRLVSRVRNTFGVEISLRLVFERPTLEQMASAITEMQVGHADPEERSKIVSDL